MVVRCGPDRPQRLDLNIEHPFASIHRCVNAAGLSAPLLGQANPGMTPNPSKAPWYFLGLQELLSRFPPLMAGVAFPTFVIVLMILVPFLDRNPSRRPSERKVAIILFALYTAIVVALVVIGTFFRGHEFVWDWGWVLGNAQTCGGNPC